MRSHRLFLCITLFLLSGINIFYGQQGDIPVFRQVTHPFMPPVTSEYFFFSEDGLIWFSTVQGLTSFDGSEIICYSSAEEAKKYYLSSIRCMVEDEKHNFYIGTSMCLIYYNRKSKTITELKYTYTDTKKTEHFGPVALCIDNGKVYAGTGMHSLFIYDPTLQKLEHVNQQPGKPDSWQDKWFNTVSSFAHHRSDTSKLWIGTYHGIYLFDKKNKTFSSNFQIITPLEHKYIPKSSYNQQAISVEKIDVADDSTIWFNSWAGGLGQYNTRSGKVKLYFRDAVYKTRNTYYGYIISRIVRYKEGKYFLGIFDPHPAIYDTRSGKLDLIQLTSDTSTIDEVRFADADLQGNIWLISKGQLYASLPSYSRVNSLPAKKQMRGVYFDTTTHQYYTTPWGIYVYDTSFRQVKTIPVPLFNNYYTPNRPAFLKITKDRNNRFWAAGEEVYILLPGQKKFDYIEIPLPELKWIKTKGYFSDVLSDKNGNILLSNTDGAVYCIDATSLHTDSIRPLSKKGNNNYEIKLMPINYDSARDKIYLSDAKTISQYDLKRKELKVIDHNELFGDADIENSAIDYSLDAEGRLWIWIPAYGVRVIEPESLSCVDSIFINKRGLVHGDFTRMRYGGKDKMFFQGRNGIIIYNYKENYSTLLDNKNGLSSPVTDYLAYCNNFLWIGQRRNIEYFNLENLDKLHFTLHPFVNRIRAGSINVFTRAFNDSSVTIYLKPWQNNLDFTFSAAEFFFPERIEYAYQLEGFDTKWNYANSINRKINYTRLNPGKYVFRLMAQAEGGSWQQQPVEYTIIISPAWWQTDWFKLLGILTVAGIIIYFVQRRIQFIRKSEQQKLKHEKELFELEARALRAQMNPHFIFNSLNSIKSLINKNENDAAANYLTTFSKLIRTLFQNSDKREISLYEELETCKLYTQLEKMRFGDKVEFVFYVDEQLDLKDIKVPALILQPFIENAIWHGLVPKETGGKVTVSVLQNNGAIECIIDDDGIGLELSAQNKALFEFTHQSKGIGLTQSRLELDKILNEREDYIRMIDKKDENGKPSGTKVILTFKEN